MAIQFLISLCFTQLHSKQCCVVAFPLAKLFQTDLWKNANQTTSSMKLAGFWVQQRGNKLGFFRLYPSPNCETKAILWALVDQLVDCRLGESLTDGSVFISPPLSSYLIEKGWLMFRLCALHSRMTDTLHMHSQERRKREEREELKGSLGSSPA